MKCSALKKDTCLVWRLALLVVACMATACNQFPKDPEQSLEKARGGVLLVGYSENPPWVVKANDEPQGTEPELIRKFAKSINARVQWLNGTEHSLFEKMEQRELPLVIAGVTDDNPWREKTGFTRPYQEVEVEGRKKKHVMVVMAGENALLVELEKFLEKEHQQGR
jgi:polar amino acid transport system substrate-binding protein